MGTNGKFVISAGFSESLYRFRGALLQQILERGWSVAALVPGVRGTSAETTLSDAGVEVGEIRLDRTGLNPLYDALYAFDLARALRRLKADYLLVYTIKPVIYGLIAGWLVGVPKRFALITGVGFSFTNDSGRGILARRAAVILYRLALRCAHKVFFQNVDDEKLFRSLRLVHPSVPSVVVNGSGVDVAAFQLASLPSAAPVFLMIARFLGDKGVREFVEAACQLAILHPEVRFRLVGWIDSNPDAISQSELDAWVADGAIEFLGKLDDVRPAIAASTVYVLPSYREGTPRTVLEAMAMGRPIITTDAPGCRETVIDGENGFLVPVKSVDALVEAMLKFIKDPTLAPRMGKRSREIAEEKYDVHKINAVMLREMGIIPGGEEHTHA